jgi:outer membrane protein assembly factor BamB
LAISLTLGLWILFLSSDYQLMNSTSPLNLAWQFQASDMIEDPPIVGTDGTIYVEAGETIYALNSENGQSKWQRQMGPKRSGFILPIANLVLITTLEDSIIQAVSIHDGKLIWEQSLQEFVQAQSPLGRPAVAHLITDDERVYVGVTLKRGTQVLAFEPSSGNLLWEASLELSSQRDIPYAMFDTHDNIIVLTGGFLFTLDKATGEIIRSDDIFIKSYRPPAYQSGTMYTSGDIVQAIDVDTLQEKWHIGHECSGLDPRIPYSPQIIDNIIYVLTTCHLVYAVSADDPLCHNR